MGSEPYGMLLETSRSSLSNPHLIQNARPENKEFLPVVSICPGLCFLICFLIFSCLYFPQKIRLIILAFSFHKDIITIY